MAAIRAPGKAKLLIGMLAGEKEWLREARRRAKRLFGETDLVSEVWPFDDTDYYAPQMGETLHRQFVMFEEPLSMDRLAEIKRLTNDLEASLANDLITSGVTRPVNLDPGYLTLSRLVLATTKDFAHRIYLERGIFAEVTLLYEHGAWRSLPWTYPDYGSGRYFAVFNEGREALKKQMNDQRH